jgi:hypothetical protein
LLPVGWPALIRRGVLLLLLPLVLRTCRSPRLLLLLLLLLLPGSDTVRLLLLSLLWRSSGWACLLRSLGVTRPVPLVKPWSTTATARSLDMGVVVPLVVLCGSMVT